MVVGFDGGLDCMEGRYLLVVVVMGRGLLVLVTLWLRGGLTRGRSMPDYAPRRCCWLGRD